MKNDIVVDFMAQAYSKKLEEIMKKDDTNMTFEDTGYHIKENRYGVKKKVK